MRAKTQRRCNAWNLKINIIFLLIPLDITVIQRYVDLNGNAKSAAGSCQRDLKKNQSVAVLHDVKLKFRPFLTSTMRVLTKKLQRGGMLSCVSHRETSTIFQFWRTLLVTHECFKCRLYPLRKKKKKIKLNAFKR